jgi:putative ABC transport system substrate-binding protein
LNGYDGSFWPLGTSMRRRQFITLLGGAATAWPIAARAQLGDPIKRIAWISSRAEDAVVFKQELARLGWVDGRDVRIASLVEPDGQRVRAAAPGIVVAAPDLIVAIGSENAEIFKRLTDTIPIVFAFVPDPVANGLVASFAHPGGNATGFISQQFSLAGKWLSILKELIPGIANVMLLYEPADSNWRGFLPVLETAASTLHVVMQPAPAAAIADVARQIETFARDPDAGMIVLPTLLTTGTGNSEMIVALAARHRLPAIYPYKYIAASGGLISYGVGRDDLTRHTAQYADRILRGAKPADLPVQAPTKFELAINLTTARALGLTVPPTLLAIADDVIE